MKRYIAFLFGLALLVGAGAALAGGGSRHGGGHGHGAHVFVGVHSGPVFVHHPRPFFRHRTVIVGAPIVVAAAPLYPYYYPPAYYPPAYSTPPAYMEQPAYAEPPVYMEQPAAQPPAAQVLYYCPDSRDYYPNVPTCPSPWMKVLP
jgi:hypothetical protein